MLEPGAIVTIGYREVICRTERHIDTMRKACIRYGYGLELVQEHFEEDCPMYIYRIVENKTIKHDVEIRN